jgi:hypothetical protein
MVQYHLAELRRELEAMTAIARIVETLDKPAARERVVRWAAEKFHIDVASTPALGNVGAPLDREVRLDEASDVPDKPAAAQQVRGKEPLDTIVRELAADLQRFTLESRDT